MINLINVIAMAKKVLWKDNTMPPTNFLWLKINAIDEIEGLFEWNGKRWVKIASGEPGGDKPGSDSAEPVKVILLDGRSYNLNSFTIIEGGIVSMLAGDSTINLTTPEYVTDTINNALFEESVSEEGDTIQILKPTIIEQITQQIGINWIEDE